MSDLHFEPFLVLAGLTHDAALIAWGGFYFRDPDRDGEDWNIVEDPDLARLVVQGRERGTIGVSSQPFGDAEVVVQRLDTGEIAARATTRSANHVRVRGLAPGTEYRYRVRVDGKPWAEGPRRDWIDDESPGGRDLEGTRLRYDTRFRTFPAPDQPTPLRFAVLGDYGVGILASGGAGDRQRRLAAALERAVDHAGVRFVLTTGDNIYLGEEDTVAGSGDHDDDWYFSYYEPYRYAISRVPVYPVVGNHDASDTEQSDDRDELADNLYTRVRFAEGSDPTSASVEPGLFYRFSVGACVELVAIDTTLADGLEPEHFFELPKHRRFLEESFPPEGARRDGPRWRIPFSHHPPYCAGPSHPNAQELIDRIVPLFRRAGVRLVLSGHEHNFQHQHVDGIDYVVSGAAGKLRCERPERFGEAGTRSWAGEGHFLLVDVDADTLVVHPVTDVDAQGRLTYVAAQAPDGSPAALPIVLRR